MTFVTSLAAVLLTLALGLFVDHFWHLWQRRKQRRAELAAPETPPNAASRKVGFPPITDEYRAWVAARIEALRSDGWHVYITRSGTGYIASHRL